MKPMLCVAWRWPELEDYAHRKEVMLNEQRTLARERIALLSTFSNDETPVPFADAISNASEIWRIS